MGLIDIGIAAFKKAKNNASAIATLNADDTTEGSVAKTVKDNAKDADYDGSTSGLTAETLGGAIDELDGKIDTHEDRLDTLEGADTVVGSVAKTVKDAVDPIDTRLTGLDTLTYEGTTYMVSRKIENGHLVTVYTEVA